MSAVPLQPSIQTAGAQVPSLPSVRRWIVSSRVDQLLILLTPLIAAPAVLLLNSPTIGVQAETISLVVAAFFATGHHLPGLIRAYGDRDLFERFRWRFLLAPPLLFLAYFPLYNYHFDLYRILIICWATWHGLMQVYGFVRIYDAKAGSVSTSTAYWDWAVCLCGFITPQFLRPESLSAFLGHLYASGVPLMPEEVIRVTRWAWLVLSLVVLAGFAVNSFVQIRRGVRPSPLKLVMLISGVGTWWFAMLYVENLLLSIALFDICHDVQYLAIVWLFNCRRVQSQADLGRFMKYVFRRGMVLLYLGLIVAYGAMAFAVPLVVDGTLKSIASAVLFTSTILHYYYDGFIWKVRESSNQVSLGLTPVGTGSPLKIASRSGFVHLLKWSPLLLPLTLLFITDFESPGLTTGQLEKLNVRYTMALMGQPELPPSSEEQSWLYSHFERMQHIAQAVPDDPTAQLRAAILLANFGRFPEAVARLQSLLTEHPENYGAQFALGGIHLYQGRLDEAADCLELAYALAKTPRERAAVNLKWGEVDLNRHQTESAELKFQAAIQDDPNASITIQALRKAFPSAEAGH